MSTVASPSDESKCCIHGECNDVAHPALLEEAAKRAKELHEKRLARIVVDQWMHVAHERLMLAWCAQMVHYWQKICSQSRWSKQQSSVTSEHHTHNRFLKHFGALRERSQVRGRNHDAAIRFFENNLRKKSVRSFAAVNSEDNEHSRQYSVAKEFYPLKSALDNQSGKDTSMQEDDGDDDDEITHGTSLGKHALHGFSITLEHAREASATIHWQDFMKAKVLKNWIIIVRRKAAERRQEDQLRALQTQILRRCISIWHSSAKQLNTERRAEVARANELWSRRNQLMKERVWAAWIQEQEEKGSKQHLKETQADELRNSNDRPAAALTAWRSLISEKERNQELSSVAERNWRKHALHSTIAIWQDYKVERVRAANDALKALDHLKKALKQKTWDAWQPWHERHASKARDLEKASQMYKTRLQRWGCERILAVGLMLQALRLQSAQLEMQPKLSPSTYLKVAPYARKWWYLSQKHRRQGKGINYKKAESSTQVPEMEDSSKNEPTMREVLLRIGLVEESLRLQPQSNLLAHLPGSSMGTQRPPTKGRMSAPSSLGEEQRVSESENSGLFQLLAPGVNYRPSPQRPSFLSKPSPGSVSVPIASDPTSVSNPSISESNPSLINNPVSLPRHSNPSFEELRRSLYMPMVEHNTSTSHSSDASIPSFMNPQSMSMSNRIVPTSLSDPGILSYENFRRSLSSRNVPTSLSEPSMPSFEEFHSVVTISNTPAPSNTPNHQPSTSG